MRYSHLGLQFAMTVGVLFYAGFWADGRLGSSPAFTLLGLAAGFGIGFYHLYKEVDAVTRRARGTRGDDGHR